MSERFKVLQLPTHPLQKNIPLELEMAREIARENVSAELLKARFEEAGYEAMLEEDGDLFLLGTWVNLRIIVHPDHAALMVRGHLTLNSELKDEDLQKICAEANFRSFLVRYVTYRWGDGEVGLIGNYVLHYPFGLNMPNFIYSVRKFVDTLRAYYEEHKSEEGLFPLKE
ncbi:MAG: hypothetical protein RL678_1551 [Pseudomonadota bacterium]|jgi:hypothetical protein